MSNERGTVWAFRFALALALVLLFVEAPRAFLPLAGFLALLRALTAVSRSRRDGR